MREERLRRAFEMAAEIRLAGLEVADVATMIGPGGNVQDHCVLSQGGFRLSAASFDAAWAISNQSAGRLIEDLLSLLGQVHLAGELVKR